MRKPRFWPGLSSFDLYIKYSELRELVCHSDVVDWRGVKCGWGLTGFSVENVRAGEHLANSTLAIASTQAFSCRVSHGQECGPQHDRVLDNEPSNSGEVREAMVRIAERGNPGFRCGDEER